MQQRPELSCGTLPVAGNVKVNESLRGSSGGGDGGGIGKRLW